MKIKPTGETPKVDNGAKRKDVGETWSLESLASRFGGPSGVPPPPSVPVTSAPPPSAPETGAPPPTGGVIGPKAPPTAPLSPIARSYSHLSQEMQALIGHVEKDLPIDSSMAFSLRLADYLKEYWIARRDILLTDDDGIALDYAKVICDANQALQDQDYPTIREAVDLIDGTQVLYYAPALKGEELQMVEAFHDLARAALFYKASEFVEEPGERHVMLTSGQGATGCIVSALDRFEDLIVPPMIQTYGGLIYLKIVALTSVAR